MSKLSALLLKMKQDGDLEQIAVDLADTVIRQEQELASAKCEALEEAAARLEAQPGHGDGCWAAAIVRQLKQRGVATN